MDCEPSTWENKMNGNGSQGQERMSPGAILQMTMDAAGMSDQQDVEELPKVVAEMRNEIEYLTNLVAGMGE